MKFTVVLAPEDGGAYSVVCPAIPGCVSQGDSLDDALANIREAITGCLEVGRKHGLQELTETPAIIAKEIELCLQDRLEDGLSMTIETREVVVAV